MNAALRLTGSHRAIRDFSRAARVKPLMPSAHGPIFCRKELREKVEVKVLFFLGLSQRTRTDFFSELLCVTIAGEFSLLDDVTPIFLSDWSQRTRTDYLS